jgi:hypothetical protein
MRQILIVLLIGAVFLAACGGSTASDNQAIIDATSAYVKANSAVANFTVQVEQVAGDYARARVSPTDGSTDPAWVYLKREGGAWQVLLLGTAFTPEDYQQFGIPESLQLK